MRFIFKWLFLPLAVIVTGFIGVFYYSTRLQDAIIYRGVQYGLTHVRTDLEKNDSLNIVFCGTGLPIAAANRAQSCIAVIAGNHFFIIDAGPGGVMNASLFRLPLADLTGVLFTHYHSDHIGSFGELVLQSWVAGRKTPLNIYGGPGIDDIAQGFTLAYKHDSQYRIDHHGADNLPPAGSQIKTNLVTIPNHDNEVIIYDQDGFKITAFMVTHEPVRPAYGYRIDYKDRSVIFSGDTSKDNNLVRFGENTDVMVHEAIANHILEVAARAANDLNMQRTKKLMSDIKNYHTTPTEAAELANEAHSQLLVFSHIGPAPNRIAEHVFLRGVSEVRPKGVTVAYDGLWLQLPTGTTEIKQSHL